MPNVTFTEIAYVEVYEGSRLVAKTEDEKGAIEAALSDAETKLVETVYTIKKPNVTVRVKPNRVIVEKGVISGQAIFSTETTSTNATT
jgi:hypothetical protein